MPALALGLAAVVEVAIEAGALVGHAVHVVAPVIVASVQVGVIVLSVEVDLAVVAIVLVATFAVAPGLAEASGAVAHHRRARQGEHGQPSPWSHVLPPL